MPWIAAIATIGSALISANASKKAASQANNMAYQPIDLDALQTKAQAYAKQNAINSLALEQELTPDLSAARFETQKQVAADLARGGNLPTDIANQVSRSAITGANAAGFTGAAGPITAANIGTTATAYRNANQEKAMNLMNANPLPISGLDPGSLASASIGQNNAINQFNMSKLGAQSAANQSQANTWSSALGGLGSIAMNASNNNTSKNTTSSTDMNVNDWFTKSTVPSNANDKR